MTGRTYRRHFLLLGGVCLLLLLGSMLVGRYGLSVDKLLHMLWTRLTGGAADWSVSDEKAVFAIRLPRIAAGVLIGCTIRNRWKFVFHAVCFCLQIRSDVQPPCGPQSPVESGPIQKS